MKIVSKPLAVFILFSLLTACGHYDDIPLPFSLNPNIVFKATLTGTQEVPANASTGTGDATLIYDSTAKIFMLTVNHTIAAPTNGHIHKGAIGVSGPVVFPFSSFYLSNNLYQWHIRCGTRGRSESEFVLCEHTYSAFSRG